MQDEFDVDEEIEKLHQQYPLVKEIGERAIELGNQMVRQALELHDAWLQSGGVIEPGRFDLLSESQFNTLVEATVILMANDMYAAWVIQTRGMDVEGMESALKPINEFLIETIMGYLDEGRRKM